MGLYQKLLQERAEEERLRGGPLHTMRGLDSKVPERRLGNKPKHRQFIGTTSSIKTASTTFRRVIESYRNALTAHDHEMQELLEDYEDFCATFDKS